jgi:hypothetical protein
MKHNYLQEHIGLPIRRKSAAGLRRWWGVPFYRDAQFGVGRGEMLNVTGIVA